MVKFAVLCLNSGKWNGRQVLPADWVKASITRHTTLGGTDYGYLWWPGSRSACHRTSRTPGLRAGTWSEGYLAIRKMAFHPEGIVLLLGRRFGRMTRSAAVVIERPCEGTGTKCPCPMAQCRTRATGCAGQVHP